MEKRVLIDPFDRRREQQTTNLVAGIKKRLQTPGAKVTLPDLWYFISHLKDLYLQSHCFHLKVTLGG